MRKRSCTFKRITDEKLAQATFLKRLKGIYKKAWELSVMCDCDLGLIMYQSGKLYQYSSRDMDNFLLRYTSSFEPVETRTNKDFDEYFKKLEDSGKLKGGVDDDDDDDGDGSEDGGFSPEANDEPANLGRKYEPQRGVQYQQAQRTAVLPPVPTTMAQSGISPLANNFPSLKIATQPSAGNDQLFSPGPFTAMFGKPLESPTNLGSYALGSPIGVNYMFTQTPTSLERPLRTNDDFLLSQNRGSVQVSNGDIFGALNSPTRSLPRRGQDPFANGRNSIFLPEQIPNQIPRRPDALSKKSKRGASISSQKELDTPLATISSIDTVQKKKQKERT